MIPELSEFSYGFALTNEIVSWSQLSAAPIFPSLIEEGRKGGGYDVKLEFPGIPLYLQFKRAHCMSRRSALEIAKYKVRLTIPFYRFYLTESGSSNQHSMLLELDDGSNAVFYAAPRFHLITQIDAAWQSSAVASRSISVRPRTVGQLDDRIHHVAYDDSATFLCSEPRSIDGLSIEALASILQEKLSTEKQPLADKLSEFLRRTDQAIQRAVLRGTTPSMTPMDTAAYDELLRIATPQRATPAVRQIPSRRAQALSSERQKLRQLADKAHTIFNAQLVIIQKRG